jgi:hypothetical protein
MQQVLNLNLKKEKMSIGCTAWSPLKEKAHDNILQYSQLFSTSAQLQRHFQRDKLEEMQTVIGSAEPYGTIVRHCDEHVSVNCF